MIRTLVMIALLAGSATADPTCAQLSTDLSSLTTKERAKLSGTANLDKKKMHQAIVEVWMDRSPHIAKAILETCPQIKVLYTSPTDPRRFKSYARIDVGSFGALVRILQMFAVERVSAYSRTIRDIEDPMFDFE